MSKPIRRTRNLGSAYVECVVFGLLGILLWLWVFNLSQKCFEKTLATTLAVFAARKALSEEKLAKGYRDRAIVIKRFGTVKTWAKIGTEESTFSLGLPQRREKATSLSFSSLFGASFL